MTTTTRRRQCAPPATRSAAAAVDRGGIGRSFGETYVAYETDEKRLVCIKVIKRCFLPCAGSQDTLDSFLAEFGSMGAMYNAAPSLFVEPLRVGLGFDNQLWFASKYCRLGTLDAVADVLLPMPGALLSAVRLIFRGISAIHAKDYWHRDLKPSNIFVDLDDEERPSIRIGDFGLARIKPADGDKLTLVGTRDFKSPELLRGVQYDGHCDVWAAAVTVLELLGQPIPDDTFDEAAASNYEAYREKVCAHVDSLIDAPFGLLSAQVHTEYLPLLKLMRRVFEAVPDGSGEAQPRRTGRRGGRSAQAASTSPPTADDVLADAAFEAADDDVLASQLKDYYLGLLRTDLAAFCTEAGVPHAFDKFTEPSVGIDTVDLDLFSAAELLNRMGFSWGDAGRLAALARKLAGGGPAICTTTSGCCSERVKQLEARVEYLEGQMRAIMMGVVKVDEVDEAASSMFTVHNSSAFKTPMANRRERHVAFTPAPAPLPNALLGGGEHHHDDDVGRQAAPDTSAHDEAAASAPITTPEELRLAIDKHGLHHWLLDTLSPDMKAPVMAYKQVRQLVNEIDTAQNAKTRNSYMLLLLRLHVLFYFKKDDFVKMVSSGRSLRTPAKMRDASIIAKDVVF